MYTIFCIDMDKNLRKFLLAEWTIELTDNFPTINFSWTSLCYHLLGHFRWCFEQTLVFAHSCGLEGWKVQFASLDLFCNCQVHTIFIYKLFFIANILRISASVIVKSKRHKTITQKRITKSKFALAPYSTAFYIPPSIQARRIIRITQILLHYELALFCINAWYV